MPYRTTLIVLTVFTAALPLLASAQITTACGVIDVFVRIVRYVGTVVIVLSVAVLLYVAFLFLTGGSNPEKVTTARNYLVWALVGIAVGIFAQYGVPFIRDILGSGVGIFSSGCSTGLPQ